jgi:hypothetical protein
MTRHTLRTATLVLAATYVIIAAKSKGAQTVHKNGGHL